MELNLKAQDLIPRLSYLHTRVTLLRLLCPEGAAWRAGLKDVNFFSTYYGIHSISSEDEARGRRDTRRSML